MQDSSIDYTELNKFNKTDQEWWDPSGEFKTLHQINPVRIDYIRSIIKQSFSKESSEISLLDIGCGGGLISAPMARMGYEVTSLDPNHYNIDACRTYSEKNNLKTKLVNKTVEDHAIENKKYDVILCLEVVEHVANLDKFLHDTQSMLKEGGVIIFSTINRTPKAYGLAIIMAEYVLRWVPQRTHDFNKFIKPSELVSKLEGTNLKLIELKGLALSVLQNKWHLSDDIDVNYFATFKKL
ncbi:MAG: hypothetical protein DGJ47_000213 [Rickettsiaceae bacterium]